MKRPLIIYDKHEMAYTERPGAAPTCGGGSRRQEAGSNVQVHTTDTAAAPAEDVLAPACSTILLQTAGVNPTWGLEEEGSRLRESNLTHSPPPYPPYTPLLPTLIARDDAVRGSRF